VVVVVDVVVTGTVVVVSVVPEEQLAANVTAAIKTTAGRLMSSPVIASFLRPVSSIDLKRT
jgi:hypothetical protein